jgi:hypothetical protein
MGSPRVPAGLDAAGRRLWREVLAGYVLAPPEVALLVELCRVVDRLDRLAAALAIEPLTVAGSMGQPKIHPLYAEARSQAATLAHLARALRIPVAEVVAPPEVGPRLRALREDGGGSA